MEQYMYFAINENGEMVSAEKRTKYKEYFCPACGNKMIKKAGKQKAPHFAHYSVDECDPWYGSKGKTEWHKKMQEIFPPDCREVKITGKNNEYHIADVFLPQEKNNIVIEFQNSPIEPKEFDERNQFYINNETKLDDKGNIVPNTIVWVFNKTGEKCPSIYINFTDEIKIEKSKDTDLQEVLRLDSYNINNYDSIFRDIRQNKNKYREIKTQQATAPVFADNVSIEWKRFNKMFCDSKTLKAYSDNIIVIFNMDQKRGISYNTDDYFGDIKRQWKVLDKEYKRYRKDVVLNSLFIYISNSKLLQSEGADLSGKCIPNDYFSSNETVVRTINYIIRKRTEETERIMQILKAGRILELHIRCNEEQLNSVRNLLSNEKGDKYVRWYPPQGKSKLLPNLYVPYDPILLKNISSIIGSSNVQYYP